MILENLTYFYDTGPFGLATLGALSASAIVDRATGGSQVVS